MYDYFTQLNHYIEYSSKHYPNKIALFIGNENFSYDEINRKSNQMANFLKDCGISKGDRVICSLGNTYESVISFWGALKAECVISMVSVDIKNDELTDILRDSEAAILICYFHQYTSTDESIKKFHYSLKKVLLKESFIINSSDFIIEFEKALEKKSEENVFSSVLDIDLAAIIYTSGSTGNPKGVMLTHRNMLSASSSINQYLEHTEKDIIISVLPISFDYGLYQMIMAFSVGASLILEKNIMWPIQLLKKISMHKATVLPIVSNMAPALKASGDRFSYNLSSIRCITNTGATLTLKHIDMLKNQFSSARIFSMYGLTECKRCTYLPPEMIQKKPTSVGLAIPNTELWVIDNEGNRLGPSQVGQLIIRGATVMAGYWRKPDKTAEKLKDGLLLSEKILYTGDYGWLDNEGYFYFYGRMDEMLKCRGIKVNPKEVEIILMQHPDIIESAIIGIEDDEKGTVLHAFVASLSGISDQALKDFFRLYLSPEQRPQSITVMKGLPKLINGKIDKLSIKSQCVFQEKK